MVKYEVIIPLSGQFVAEEEMMTKHKYLKMLSLLSLIICIFVWIPNMVFQISSPFWLLTFIVAPVGIVFAVLIKKYWLIVANTLMFFSFFIFMFIGYFINYLTDGKP